MKTMKKFTTQEQFERNCEINPSIGSNDRDGEKTVGVIVIDNRIGEKILCLTMVNPSDRFKDFDFYGTPEWMKIKPQVIKLLYQLYSLYF